MMKTVFKIKNSQTYTRFGLPLFVLLLALLPRLLSLKTFLTADEDDQLQFASQFLLAVLKQDWEGALVLGYPGVPTLALGALGLWLQYQANTWNLTLNFITQWLPSIPTTQAMPELVYHAYIPLINHIPLSLANTLATVSENPLPFIRAVRLPMAIAASLTITLMFVILRQLLNPRLALLATLLIAFDPIFLANSRVIHVDAPLTYFMFSSFLAFLLYIKKGQLTWLIGSGILGGLAILSKTPAAILAPILFVGGGLYAFYQPGPLSKKLSFKNLALKRWAFALIGWGVCAAIAFFVFWPSMWARPTFALTWIFSNVKGALTMSHPSSGEFWGRLVTDQSPWYYFIALPFHLTPLTSIGLLGGLVCLIMALKNSHLKSIPSVKQSNFITHLPLLAATFAYSLIFLGVVSLVSRRGVRYLLPIFPALSLIATVGLWTVVKQLSYKWATLSIVDTIQRYTKHNVAKISTTLLKSSFQIAIAWQLVSILSFHPYYFNYFNPLLGGGDTAPYYVAVGWGEGLDEAAHYLNKKPQALKMEVSAWYAWQFAKYFKGETIDLSRNEPAYYTDYTVFYINQVQRGFPSKELLTYFADREPEKIINLHGVDYAWIYPGPIIGNTYPTDLPHVFNATFNEAITLVGLNRPCLPTTQVSCNPAPLTLYWQVNAPLPPDLNVSIRIVDEAGIIWGQVDRLPIGGLRRTDKWEPQSVIRDEYKVPLDSATPPGNYSLDILLYDFKSGDIFGQLNQVAQFSLKASDEPIELANLTIPYPLEVQLAPNLYVIGHNFESNKTLPGYEQSFKLYWQLNRPLKTAPSITLIARPETGSDISLLTKPVGPQNYNPTQWPRGQVLADALTFSVPVDAPPARYQLLAQVDGSSEAILGHLTVLEQPHTFKFPPTMQPFNAKLGKNGEITLAGYTLNTQAGAVDLTLYWQAQNTPSQAAKVFIHIIDDAGNIVAQQDAIPANGNRPTTTWVANEVISGVYHLSVPSGQYTLWLGMYNPDNWQRLPIVSEMGEVSENRVQLGMVEVE